MVFKINIGTKSGKTYKLEAEAPLIIGKKINEKIKGEEINSDLKDYEFEISGASDSSGFPAIKDVEGVGLKKVLLTYGRGMKKHPKKEGKKKRSNSKPKGLRLRKTLRGEIISKAISQINLKIIKQGSKTLEEIFPGKSEISETDSKDKKE